MKSENWKSKSAARSLQLPRTNMIVKALTYTAFGVGLLLLGIAGYRILAPARVAASQPSETAAVFVNHSPEAVSGSRRTFSAQRHEQDMTLALGLLAVAESNPAAAASRLPALPPSLRNQYAAAIASAWAKTEPEVAANWARNLPEGEGRSEALFSLSAEWADANPGAAAECGLADLPESRQGEFLNVVGNRWSRQDPAAALLWAENKPDGVARQKFLAGVCSALAENAPEQAARVVSGLAEGQLQQETALTVVLEWARRDTKAAAEWVRLFPEGLRQQALNGLVSVWAEIPGVSSPLLCWPEGPERDAAIRRYLDEILETQPARGVEVLSAISDAALRNEEIQRVAQHWMSQNPAEAAQWLAQEQLSLGVAH